MNASIRPLFHDSKTPAHVVTIPNLELFFSYETCVAFRTSSELFCCENDWGSTTGKHLNQIQPDKSKRLPRVEFERELDRINITLDRLEVTA